MNIMKKIHYHLAILLLFLPIFTIPMNPTDSLGNISDSKSEELINRIVLEYEPLTFLKAIEKINQLETEDYRMGEFFNTPKNCLRLVKRLSNQFEKTDKEVCSLLTFAQAKRQLNLQEKLNSLCAQPTLSFKDLRTFSKLRDQGIDVNFTSMFMENVTTPLIQAIDSKNMKLIHLLLQTNADPNLGTYDGNPPLIAAIMLNNKDLVKALLNAGAKIFVHNKNLQLPSEVARMKKNKKIIALIENAEKNSRLNSPKRAH